MGKVRELKVSDRSRIVALRDAKWTIKRISKDVGCSMSTVNYRGERTRTGQQNYFVDILKKKLARGNLIMGVCRAYFSLHTQIFS